MVYPDLLKAGPLEVMVYPDLLNELFKGALKNNTQPNLVKSICTTYITIGNNTSRTTELRLQEKLSWLYFSLKDYVFELDHR